MLDIQLLSHFDDEQGDFIILKLKPDETDEFLAKLPSEYRKCYITDENLLASVKEFNMQYSAILKDHYLPDPGYVMSGEFGEILSYFLLKERYLPENELDGPKKWQWKDDRNQASPKTDVMLFGHSTPPSPNDLLVSAEVKSKATKNNSNDPIKNAVVGVRNDFVSRLSTSLTWLRSKYVKDRNTEEVNRIERFLDPVTYGTYQKHFKAVIVIEDTLLAHEVSRDRDLAKFDAHFEILLVSIQNLKKAYEQTYLSVLASGNDIL